MFTSLNVSSQGVSKPHTTETAGSIASASTSSPSLFSTETAGSIASSGASSSASSSCGSSFSAIA